MTNRPFDPINPSLSTLGKCCRCGHDTITGEPCDEPRHDAVVILYGMNKVPHVPGQPHLGSVPVSGRPADKTDDFGMRFCQGCLHSIMATTILQKVDTWFEQLTSTGHTAEQAASIVSAVVFAIVRGHGDMIHVDMRVSPEDTAALVNTVDNAVAMFDGSITIEDPDDYDFGGDAA